MKDLRKWQSLLKNQTKIQYNKELLTALFLVINQLNAQNLVFNKFITCLLTQPVHVTATYRFGDTRCCIIQF